MHVPARLPRLRMRRAAVAPGHAAARDPPERDGGSAEPEGAVRAPPRGGDDWLAGGSTPPPSPCRRRTSANGGATRCGGGHAREAASSGSPSVPSCSRASSSSTSRCCASTSASTSRASERTRLRAENAALQSALSAALASPRVQERARRELKLAPAIPRPSGTSTSRDDEGREAGQPPDPPAPRLSRRRPRRHPRARGLAPGNSRSRARRPRAVTAPPDGDHPRAAGNDLRPLGRPARDRRGEDDGLRRPEPDPERACGRSRGGEGSRRRRERSLPAAPRPPEALRPDRAVRRAGGGGPARAARVAGARVLLRGAALVPAADGRGAGRRVRRRRQPGAVGSRGRAGTLARREARPADDHPRPGGAGDRRPELDVGALGPRRLPHDRPPHPGAGGAGDARDGRQVACEGGLRGRARPVDGRDPRPCAGAGLRRERCEPRAAGDAAEPRGHGPVRAGLDIQARDGRPGRSPRVSSHLPRRSRSRTRSRSPTAGSTTPSRGRPRR